MKTKSVMILENKIARIFEQVYSVNESLTSSEKKQLIKGFEDGINEIFGSLGTWAAKAQKFATSMGQQAKQAYTDMVNKGKAYYEKGKQLAGQAWDAIQSFAKGVVDGFKTAVAKASDFVVSNYQSFKQTLATAYQSALKQITDSYNSMKDKAQAFAEACKGIWSDILEETALLIQSSKEKMKAAKDSFNKWMQSNKVELQKNVELTKQSTIDSLKTLAAMTSSVLSKTAQVAGDIACVGVFICVFPVIQLINGVKAIPGVYDSAVEMVKQFVAKEVQEVKTSYQTEMAKKESFRYLVNFENFK